MEIKFIQQTVKTYAKKGSPGKTNKQLDNSISNDMCITFLNTFTDPQRGI